MAGDSQMHESERGLFTLSGITGMLIATVLLLSILAGLTIGAISVQSAEATNFYSVNEDLEGLKMIDSSANQNANYKLED